MVIFTYIIRLTIIIYTRTMTDFITCAAPEPDACLSMI